MWDPGLNFLALVYRCVYTIAAGYISARLAPRNPMRHVWVLGFIGLVMAVAGVIGTSGMDLGPRWYPIALAVTFLALCLARGSSPPQMISSIPNALFACQVTNAPTIHGKPNTDALY